MKTTRSKISKASFNQELILWFKESGRKGLPWREAKRDPYQVWVSEVMLQQTQVTVVIPYFNRWMTKYPTIKALAQAPINEVIKMWEGLGYYSRARNLHEGAQLIMTHFNGIFPSRLEDLAKIKGLGPYTIGAIRSFAFKQKASAVDGNVIRVLSRVFHIEEDIGEGKTLKKIRTLADTIIPDQEHWIFNEALIELGALICTKTPKCSLCPIKESCLAFQKGNTENLPIKLKKTVYTKLFRAVTVIECRGHLLLKKGKKGEIMNDLHEFPYFEMIDSDIGERNLRERWEIPLHFQRELKSVTHSFTKYRVHLTPYMYTTNKQHPIEGYKWIPLTEIHSLAFSSGHKKVLKQL